MTEILKCAGSVDFKKSGAGCKKYEDGRCYDVAAVLQAIGQQKNGYYISFKDYSRCSGCDALKPIKDLAKSGNIWVEDGGKMHSRM